MKRFILLIVLFFSSFVFAQKDTMKYSLSEVVISATKNPTSSIHLASSFTLITENEIANKQKPAVIDLLREVPGLAVTQSGGPGAMSNVFMRGANSNHTLVVLDGIVLNDPSSVNGAYDFSSLLADNIERIEIVRGPQSTLYGSEAVAGIINIFSRRPAEGLNLSLSAETGSNNMYKGNLSAMGSLGQFSYSLGYAKMKTDGISAASSRYGNTEKDKFESDLFSSNLRYNILPNLTAGIIYRYTKSKGDLDQNERLGDDPNFRTDFEEHLVRGTVESEIIKGVWSSVLGFSNVRKINHTTDDVDALRPNTSSYAFNNAARTKFDWQNNLNFINNNKIIIGIETEVEKANTNYYSESAWGPYYSEFAEQSNRTTGIFVQDQFSAADKLYSTVGLRYDYNEKFGGQATFRIAPSYLITETGTKIKATYGTGFKAPSLYYLFDPIYGNQDLKPEKSNGWDVGVEQYLLNYRLSLGVTLFQIKFEDMIGMDANYKAININKAESNGVEAFANYSPGAMMSVKLNYTYTYAVDKSENSFEKDLLLIRRPMHKASLDLNYKPFDMLNLNCSIVYTGKRDDKDFSGWTTVRVTLPDYTLVNAAASYKVTGFLTLKARLENIFDKYYEDILYYGTMGRNFSVGFSLNY
jgi:vitamin B12 transporter